jgi:IS30 family transposase
MRHRHWSQPQASHRHGGGALKRVHGHGEGFKQYVGLGGSAIIKALKPFEARVTTLAYDTGKEFSGHAKKDEVLGSTGYFAQPFASWERGSNENFNVLLRQYVHNKRQLANITGEELKMIENRLNNHPRKRLGFKTAAKVFDQSLPRVALLG